MGIGSPRQSKHLRWAGFLYSADFLLVWVSFLMGIWLRFGEVTYSRISLYLPGIALASVVLPSILYVAGLYSSRPIAGYWFSQFRWILLGLIAVVASILIMGSLDFSSRVGRGVLLVSMVFLSVGIILRQTFVISRRQRRLNSFLCLVSGESDEKAAVKLFDFWGRKAKTFGIVTGAGYEPSSKLPCIGSINELSDNAESMSADVVLVRDRHFTVNEIAKFLRGMRYHGADILPLSDACEDAYHAVPIELITDAWLFRASSQSELFYIRKLKRLSDIALASFFLVVLSPFLAFGACIVRLASPGPVIFRQDRAGRLGRPFTLLKLRTMHVENDTSKAKWANEEKKRIFPLGGFLRKFRIDEIPQLINVLKGEMSFVGPRPEQISIVEDLARELPFYRERLLIQPGITGWAQVNYPYGASVADAARKLEYDLYYMKHMGIFFDFFILLETVKIILCGGVRENGDGDYMVFRENMRSFSEEENHESGAEKSDSRAIAES